MADPDVDSDPEDLAAPLTTRGIFPGGFWKLDRDIRGRSYKAEMTLTTTRLRKVIIKLKGCSEEEVTDIVRIIKPFSRNRLLLTYQDGVVLSVHGIEVRLDRFDNPIELDRDRSLFYYRYCLDERRTVSILKSLKVFLPNNLQICRNPTSNQDVHLQNIIPDQFVDYLEYCIGQKNQPDNLANSLKIARRFTPPHFQLHDGCINVEDENHFQYVAMSSGTVYPLDRQLGPTDLIIIEPPVNYIDYSHRQIPFSESIEDFPRMYNGITCRVFVYSSMIQQHEFLSIGFLFEHVNKTINFRIPVTASITFEHSTEDLRMIMGSTISRVITQSTPTMGCPVFMNISTYRTFLARGPGMFKVSISREDDEEKLREYGGINRDREISERGRQGNRTVRHINTQLLQNAFNREASAQNTQMFHSYATMRRIFDILYHGTTDLTNRNIVDVYTQANAVGCHQVMEYCNQAIQASYPEGEKTSNIEELVSQRRELARWQAHVNDEIYLQNYINTMNDIENKPIDEYSPCVVYRFPNGGFHHSL